MSVEFQLLDWKVVKRVFSVGIVDSQDINMKLVVVLLNVACIAMCAGDPVDVDTEERDSGFRFTQEMCPRAAEIFYHDVTRVGIKCIEMGAINITSYDLTENNLEEIREFFKQFCQRKPIVRQCLLEATTQIEVCNNESFATSFKIYRDLIETTMEVGCVDDGERVSNLVHGIFEYRSNKEVIDSFRHCFGKSHNMVMIIDQSYVDISTKFYNLNKVVKTLGECLYQLEVEVSLKDSMKFYADGISNNMKCIHPEDRVLIPCGQIDAGLFNVTNVCDLKTHGTNMSLYDVLEEDFVSSLLLLFRYPETEITNDDMIRDLVSYECEYLRGFYDTSVVSEMCLNVAQQNEFQLFGDVIKSGFDAACHDNGTRLLDMMIGVYRMKNSGHGHAVWECVAAVRSARNESDEQGSSSKNLRFYHELEAFKGCLVDKLGGDVTSITAATTLIDEALKVAKCVHPEDGTTVLCETLVVKA